MEPRVGIVLRPLGSPLPLGFFAFGIGSILTGALQLGWIPQDETRLVALIGLCFVAPLELIAGLIAFAARDGAAGTTLALFGGSWVALAIAIHQLGANPVAMRVAGWIGVGVAAVALYGGLALLLEDAQLRTLLPTGRRGKAQEAIEEGFDRQVEKIEREAGVRNQL